MPKTPKSASNAAIRARLQELSRVFVTGLAGPLVKDVYATRRAQHLEAAEFPWIFHGLEREPGSEHDWIFPSTRLYQEPSVQYLCGLNQTGVSLVLVPGRRGAAGRAVLFLPARDPSREFWDGVRVGLVDGDSAESRRNLSELRGILGIEDIRPAADLPSFLDELAGKHAKLGVFHHRYREPSGREMSLRTDPNWAFARSVTGIARRRGAEVVSIVAEHFRLRMPLDGWQLREAERAQEWTRKAFVELLPQIPRMSHEHQIAGMLEGLMLFQSPWGLAFPTICASGSNAATLHYMKNDDPLPKGGLVLLDFGCRSATMHADISRTVPLEGRFDPLQRLLYGIVLDVQRFSQSLLRPGITVRELNRLSWARMEELLEERFLAKGGTMERPYVEGNLATLPGKAKAHPCQPHGISHLMGEQEHDGDPFRLYQDQPVEPGWMLSNEPGLYGRFRIRLSGRTYDQHLGIRIEDDLVATPDGCINLSQDIPKDPDALEILLAGGKP